MFTAARKDHTDLVPTVRIADPECSAIVAILYINSQLSGYGGYEGIGAPYGYTGLLPNRDRGPGHVLRSWSEDPVNFDVEEARSLYNGY
jgi:hypothetical protein